MLSTLTRGDIRLRRRIVEYARVAGISPPSSPGGIDNWHYSAVFISFCIRLAGASLLEFPSADRHSTYIKYATEFPDKTILRIHRPDNYAPRVGDLLNTNRNAGTIGFASAGHDDYRSEGGVIANLFLCGDRKFAKVIFANNVNGTISSRDFRLTDGGKLVQPVENPIICVLETLK